MERWQTDLFVAAAERDYDTMVRVYAALVTEALALGLDETRVARADVLAAQQVLMLARQELGLAVRRADQAEAAEVERVMREEQSRGR